MNNAYVSYDDIRDYHTLTERIQRLGYDEHGRPLVADNVVGPLTRGATYLSPTVIARHELPAVALLALHGGAREYAGARNRGQWPLRVMPDRFYGGPWCAGFASWCLREAYPGHDTPYIVGARRLGLAVIEEGEVGRKLDAEEIVPGDLLIWNRDGPDDGDDVDDDWNGHVGICCHVDDDWTWTIDGNRGPLGAVRVWRHDRKTPHMHPRKGPFLFGARWAAQGVCR